LRPFDDRKPRPRNPRASHATRCAGSPCLIRATTRAR